MRTNYKSEVELTDYPHRFQRLCSVPFAAVAAVVVTIAGRRRRCRQHHNQRLSEALWKIMHQRSITRLFCYPSMAFMSVAQSFFAFRLYFSFRCFPPQSQWTVFIPACFVCCTFNLRIHLSIHHVSEQKHSNLKVCVSIWYDSQTHTKSERHDWLHNMCSCDIIFISLCLL